MEEDKFNTISKMSFGSLMDDNAIRTGMMTNGFLEMLDENDILKPIEYINYEMADGKIIKEPYYYDSQILTVFEVVRIKNAFKDLSELKGFKSIEYYNLWALRVKKMEKFFDDKNIYKNEKYKEFYDDTLKRKIESSKGDNISREELESEVQFDARLDFRDWWQYDGGAIEIKKEFVDFVVNKLGITLKELKKFREDVILFSSFHRMYGHFPYLFWNYVKYIPDIIILKFEYAHYLINLLNEYISFFDGENFLSVKHVIYDISNGCIDYEKNPDVICNYCGKKYIKEYPNQKHCLSAECMRRHKKVLNKMDYKKNKEKIKEQRKNKTKRG